MKKNILIYLIMILILLCSCSTAGKSDTPTKNDSGSGNTAEIFAMDTYMTLTAYGDKSSQALNLAKDKIKSLDETLSVGDKNSDIYKLNNNGKCKFSKESADILKKSEEIYKNTNGVFNPAVYPLMKLWGFTDQNYKVPTEKEIKSLLKNIDLSDVEFDEKTLDISFKKNSMGIDFGGIAKGYTSSQLMKIFKDNGIKSAMVSLGGNVQVLGTKPDGSLWKVGIQNPDGSDNHLGIVSIKDKAIITSGGYERYFEKDNKKYHHILDPKTGYPAESDLQSVTVVSSDGTLADAYSTALFVMGLDKSIDFWRNNSEKFDAVFYTNNNELYVTENLIDNFSSENKFIELKNNIQ